MVLDHKISVWPASFSAAVSSNPVINYIAKSLIFIPLILLLIQLKTILFLIEAFDNQALTHVRVGDDAEYSAMKTQHSATAWWKRTWPGEVKTTFLQPLTYKCCPYPCSGHSMLTSKGFVIPDNHFKTSAKIYCYILTKVKNASILLLCRISLRKKINYNSIQYIYFLWKNTSENAHMVSIASCLNSNSSLTLMKKSCLTLPDIPCFAMWLSPVQLPQFPPIPSSERTAEVVSSPVAMSEISFH